MENRNAFADSIKTYIDKDIERRTELYIRYQKYIEGYKEFFKEDLLNEFILLKENFPNVDFYCRGRIKSYESYRNKVDEKLSANCSGNVYDAYAKKYVIRAVDGKDDEQTLIKMCYEFGKFLTAYKHSYRELKAKRKDYIDNPKESSYQSLHITKAHKQIDDLFIETQIKTSAMEDNAKFGEASHSEVYKDRTIDISRLPTYLIPVSLNDGVVIYEQTVEEAFKYFFGVDYNEYTKKGKQEVK